MPCNILLLTFGFKIQCIAMCHSEKVCPHLYALEIPVVKVHWALVTDL